MPDMKSLQLHYKKLYWLLPLLAGAVVVLESTKQPPPPETVPHVEKVVEETVPDFAAIADSQTKKASFFAYLRPFIQEQNQLVSTERKSLMSIRGRFAQSGRLNADDLYRLQELATIYRLPGQDVSLSSIDALLKRVDTIPAELVLVQAANESAWGTSRFAREGHNFFGQWCFKKGCGLVPLHREEGATHEVARFKSAKESVRAYFLNLNSHSGYDLFREIRNQLRQAKEPLRADILVTGLINYSSRQLEYVSELSAMLRHNRSLLRG